MASCGFRTDIQQVFTPTEAELAENDPEVPFFLWKLRMQGQLQYSLIGDEQCITMYNNVVFLYLRKGVESF